MQLDGVPQEIEINHPLSVGGEDELPRIASLDNVVRNVYGNDTS
jgi:hypothetical protein